MGTLIAPNLVLTAAHNVFSKNYNSKAEFLTFIPGILESNSLYGISIKRSIVNKVYFNENYITSNNAIYNYAILSNYFN